jgi:hypothetical protein
MRRTALLGLTLLLPACENYVGNPLVGFGGFIGDTHSIYTNPNRPPGDAPNMLRVEGQEIAGEPLAPEPGNVWPGPIAPEPTLQDLERQQNPSEFPGQPSSAPAPRGGSLPPGAETRPAPPTALRSVTPPSTQVYQTPHGPAVSAPAGNGVQTYTDPKGGTGIMVPNGNGTSTMIGPDGSVSTVPNAR